MSRRWSGCLLLVLVVWQLEHEGRQIEKNGRKSNLRLRADKAHHGRKRRLLTTQAGDISLARIDLRCVKCQTGGDGTTTGKPCENPKTEIRSCTRL